MSQLRSDFDTPWKEILDIYFKDFIAYCWPEKYLEIDWQRGYKMLDKELSKIARNAPVGNRVLDKLVEVYQQDGQEVSVLVHIEVQRSENSNFGERMLVYRYRLRDLHQKPIASLAILIDNNGKWRPTSYKEAFWDSSLEIRFRIIKLIDYKTRFKELEASTNPFASVILAQLATLKKQLPENRLITKINLTKRLYSCKWQKDDILRLYRFIDWIMALPAPLEIKYQKAIDEIEEELHVAYITTAERIGIQKGIQQGIVQGESTLLLQLLEHKFKIVPEDYRQKINHANTEILLTWGKRALDCQSLEEIFKA